MGFEASVDEKEEIVVEQIMSTACHVGGVRAAAGCARYAVTGGTDELINVFDVEKRTHLGTMGGSVHTSTVTAVAVTPSSGLLVSGCEEGHIALTRLKDSHTLKSFKGHKAGVLDIACHPSGKLALSISTDNTLRMWDLTRGTCAAVRTVCHGRRPNALRGPVRIANMQVKYTPEGSRYALLLPGGIVEMCSSSSADAAVYEPSTTITSICPVSEDMILVGDSKGVLRTLQVQGDSLILIAELSDVHTSRIKGIGRLGSAGYACSVDAQGKMSFVSFKETGKLVEIRSIETGARVTTFASNR